MTRTIETDVLVIGGGPVGLTLAMDLARRGVAVTVLEQRPAGEPPSVKCNHVAARSMELFRRLGVARKLRDAGLPADYPNDISFRTTMLGKELTRIEIPCRRDRYRARGGPDTWWPTPEPPHRINQIYLEPVLFAHAKTFEEITIVNEMMFEDLSQGMTGVTAQARKLGTGERLAVSARYLIGCDGGRSEVRRQIGARLLGDAVVQRVQSSYIRAPGLLSLQEGKPAWVNISLNPRRSGSVYAIDGRETFLVHNYLREDEEGFESVDRDPRDRAGFPLRDHQQGRLVRAQARRRQIPRGARLPVR
jgi:2-polyprenyl-6-methoxyphenol hydroxylase-like FAD-dependent oxidoreductase